MLYQLPNGKVVEMSVEQFLGMSDEELNQLSAHNYGDVIEDPFFGSSLSKHTRIDFETEDEEEEIIDLLTASTEEKILDLDIDTPIIEE